MFSIYLLDSINLQRLFRAVSLPVVFLLPITPAFAAEADLSWTNLSQEYDGHEKSPVVTTEPPNLEVTLEYFPRSNSEVLFQRIPEVDQPSYPSYGLNGKVDTGLGDLVDLHERRVADVVQDRLADLRLRVPVVLLLELLADDDAGDRRGGEASTEHELVGGVHDRFGGGLNVSAENLCPRGLP